MAVRARRNGGNGLDAWPGYVDALSTLVMVIIFVLLVFVLAQAFLSVVLSGRDKALDQVKSQLAALTSALSLEKSHSAELRASIAQLNQQLVASGKARDLLTQQLAALQARANDILSENQKLRSQEALLDKQLAAATAQAGAADQKTATEAADLAITQRLLADAQQRLADMQQQMAELNKTVRADKDTMQLKLADLARLEEQTRALAALRDQLQKEAADAAARAVNEQQRREATATLLANEKKLGESARAQIALLNQQVDQLKAQLASVAKALDLAQQQGRDKDVQIANLGQKLNAALAAKVQELQQYRSEFFGKLRQVLAGQPGIHIAGDRFVFQSEVLFPLGRADLTPDGVAQMTALAVTIKDIAAEIPKDIPWILRVDGHTDPQPVKAGLFASNWELSSARAITVVKLLIADGVPPEHLAATGFASYQPIGAGATPEDFAKDRRIELRLTDR